MLSRHHFLHLTEAGGEVRRPPLFAVRLLHEPPVGATDLFGGHSRVKDLASSLFAHFVGWRRVAPRCHVAVRVFTPSGMPAVKIRFK
jgi:hypothetical protein